MPVNIPVKFINEEQKLFFNCTTRNLLGSGGLGSGKTYILCLKALILLATFPKYRFIFARKTYKTLRRTTMSTFYKICPPKLYNSEKGGRRSDLDGHLRLTNGSEIFWIGLDNYDEQDLKGIESNSCAVDQAEELDENIFLHLDSRIDRWELAEVPPDLVHLNFPIHPITGKPKPPAYSMLSCNPDNELHWLWKRFHPDSPWKRPNHTYINFPSTSNIALSPETLAEMMSRDDTWVQRFVYGIWGIGGGAIHRIFDESIINPSPAFLETAIKFGHCYRVMDHGEFSPTCVLWIVVYKGWNIVYREYYKGETLISDHRKNIETLSAGETYVNNLADPAIFKLTSQKFGGRWATSDDYIDDRIVEDVKIAPPIYWQPADNSELLCRSQVSELLKIRSDVRHPITNKPGAPLLYFVQKTDDYPDGCLHSITQTRGQRRKKIGEENGKEIFTDERNKKIPDHAYDPIRYFCVSKISNADKELMRDNPNSFFALRKKVIQSGPIMTSVPSNLYRT